MAARQLLSYLILALICTLSAVTADVFVSIDCGSSSNSYTDGNLIIWTGDRNYTKTGESRSVRSSNSISPVLDTLRVFTTRKKNCYRIDSMRRGRVLVRATFHYGNYDGRSLPPTFDLMIDGNLWATVETSNQGYVYYEVSYVMNKDVISVCVAQTEQEQVPFISALEVRGLESFTYAAVDSRYPLFLRKRVAYGANATIRYPNDPYDRIWTPEAPGTGLVAVRSDAALSGAAGPYTDDMPPPAVLKNAIIPTRFNGSITLAMGFPPENTHVYINFYFSEVSKLGPRQKRSFGIFGDGNPVWTPIYPLYDNCTQLNFNHSIVNSTTTVALVPTNESTLPPLINALEVFDIGFESSLTAGTNQRDVEGLGSLQKAFTGLQDWSGDPCLPAPYTWDWIDCSNDSTPRVTSMFLASFGLSRMLPDFSSMDALRTIDLHNNSLSGPIPDFLGKLPNLKILNLSSNQFNGSIPPSLSSKNGLTLMVTGNPNLRTPGQSCPNSSSRSRETSSGDSKKIKSILPIIFGTFISFFVLFDLKENLLR